MNNEHTINSHTVGLFIINTHNEMLLHKNQTSWEPPLLSHNEEKSPLQEAQQYLATLDLHCELYEAFTTTTTPSNHTQPFKGGRVVIALTKSPEIPLHFATDSFKWMPLEKLLHDMHEKPLTYALWFRKIIDGVALYLKNLLQEKHGPTTSTTEWRNT